MPIDPQMSEWGNPPEAIPARHRMMAGKPGELKHLTTRRKRKQQ